MHYFGDKPLKEIFADQTPVSIFDPVVSWLNIPPKDFIEYTENHQALPFEGVPGNDQVYRKTPNYMITQTHRLWLTLDTLLPYLPKTDDYHFLDIGAHPYSLEVILREYCQYKGEIQATANLPIENIWRPIFDQYGIRISYVNLDKYVLPDSRMPDIPDRLSNPDNSLDVILLAHVIEHLYHPLELLKDIARVLKPGGHLVISTDHAFRLSALVNMLSLNPFLHDPVDQTSALTFDFWRGHNRFFTEWDLRIMLERAGLKVERAAYCEFIFNSLNESYYKEPIWSIPKWKADILTKIPQYRNEIVIIATKE